MRKNLHAAAIWLLLLSVLASYWVFLLASHQAQIDNVQTQTRQRAAQTAHALSLQVGTLLKTIDYVSRNLGDLWLNGDATVLQQSIGLAQNVLPKGALTQVTVANLQGEIIFAGIGDQVVVLQDHTQRISIADRQHFQVHLRGGAPQMFISKPVMGRITQKWTVQFSAPLLVDGKLRGVMVLSVSTDYLSQALSEVFSDAGNWDDVAILLRSDGFYLARSHSLEKVLGKEVPPDWEFLHLPQQESGGYEATPPVDGIERYYAWHRTPNYPVLVNVGLGKAKALAEVRSLTHSNMHNNLLATAALLLAAGWITALWLKQRRQSVALAATSERLELVLRGGDMGSWDFHFDSQMVDCSQRWALMFGYGDEAITLPVAGLTAGIHPDDTAKVLAALQLHLDGDTPQYEARYRRRHHRGNWVWVIDRGRVVAWSPDGSPLRIVGTTLDVTAHKLVEQAEQAYRERLTKLVAQVPGVVYQYLRRPDKTDCFVYASPGLWAIFGVPSHEALQSSAKVFACIHPSDFRRIARGTRRAELRMIGWRGEFRVLQFDGSVRWVLAQAKPERVPGGGIHWYGYANDVTLEHEAAEKLKLSEEHLRSTLQAVRDGLWSWDVASGELQWDARVSEMLGYAGQQKSLGYAQWVELLHPLDRKRAAADWHVHLSGHIEQVFSVQYRLRTAQRQWLWVEVRGRVVVWSEDGLPVRMIGTLSDVSAKVADSQLRRAVLDQSTAAIAMFTKERRLVYANERAMLVCAELGLHLDPRSTEPITLSDLFLSGLEPYVRTLRSAGEVRFEYKLQTDNGAARWFDIHAVLRDPEDLDSDGVWTLIDITQKNTSEEALATEHLRLTTLLQRFPGGVLMQDADGVVAMINQQLCDLFDLPDAPSSLQGLQHRELCGRLGELRASWLHLPSGAQDSEKRSTIEVDSPDGQTLEINWVPITRDNQELGRVWLVHDISERRQREEALATLAATDMLTGLPNRRSFMAALELALLGASTCPGPRGVLLMADIDYFKRVNDTYGHVVGDGVLKHVAQLLRQGLRQGLCQSDAVGRIGGEEFAVLLNRIDLADGLALANRIRQSLADSPAITTAGSIAITMSIGLVVLEGNDAIGMLSRADEALYAAKNTGRNRVCTWQAPNSGDSTA